MLVEYVYKYVHIRLWLFDVRVLTSCFYLICKLWSLTQSVFKLPRRKRTNEKEQCFFCFPSNYIYHCLRTQPRTTGCEFNQVEPLNKAILVVVEFFTSHHPVHMFP